MEKSAVCMKSGMLIRDVAEEVRRWTKLAWVVPDELIEWEMSYSLGKWTDLIPRHMKLVQKRTGIFFKI